MAYIQKPLFKIYYEAFNHKPGNTEKKREEAISLCLLESLTLSWLFKYAEDSSLNMYPPSKSLRISYNTVPVHRVWRMMGKMYNQLVISSVFLQL